MDLYFPRSATLAEGVRFILPVEPVYEASRFASSQAPSARLLNRAVLADLQHITEAQHLHSNRIRSLADRLEIAGLQAQRSQLLFDSETGEKSIIIDFHPSLHVDDLKQAVGWTEPWFEIVEPMSSLESSVESLSPIASSLMESSEDEQEDEEQEVHDLVAQSFVLPKPHDDLSRFLLELEELPRPFV